MSGVLQKRRGLKCASVAFCHTFFILDEERFIKPEKQKQVLAQPTVSLAWTKTCPFCPLCFLTDTTAATVLTTDNYLTDHFENGRASPFK